MPLSSEEILIRRSRTKKEAVDTSGISSHNNDRSTARLVMRRPVFGDIRCRHCNALLYREMRKSESTDRIVEIKCWRCNTITVS